MTGDMKLAHVVGSLFRDTPHKPRGTLLHDATRGLLLSDPALAAYFAAVIQGGDEAWREERTTMGYRQRRSPPQERGDPMSVTAIAAMLPAWRHWGQILIDAGEVPDLDGMFRPPG